MEMGTAEFRASFVYGIVAILLQRLVLLGHDNDTLLDRSNELQNNCGRFYCGLTLKPSRLIDD